MEAEELLDILVVLHVAAASQIMHCRQKAGVRVFLVWLKLVAKVPVMATKSKCLADFDSTTFGEKKKKKKN